MITLTKLNKDGVSIPVYKQEYNGRWQPDHEYKQEYNGNWHITANTAGGGFTVEYELADPPEQHLPEELFEI